MDISTLLITRAVPSFSRLFTRRWRMDCFLSVLLVSSLLLSSCSRDGDTEFDKTINVDQPNNFAAYINPINGLASGEYRIEANADVAGSAGDFTLSVTHDDGTTEEFSGSWTAAVSTQGFTIKVYTAGGIDIVLTSAVESNLRLLNSNGFVVATADATLPANSRIMLETSRIDSSTYGAKYYEAIDPINEKDTLEKWKQANGYYLAREIVEPRFRDTKDLGYGRGMRMWTRPDGSLYFFVENFQLRTIPGQEYTSLNLDALLSDVRKHHFGSNAIEFSTYPYGVGEPSDKGSTHKFAKFYTFDATQGSQVQEDHGNEVRLDEVNLDGRGLKAMPGACVYCHGGTLRPLRADGTFRDNTLDGMAGNGLNGDVNAKLQLLEVPSFEYGDYSPFTKAEQEPLIKKVNMAIYCTYPNLPAAGIAAACSQFCVDPADTANCDGAGNSLEAIMTCKVASNTADCDGNGNDLATVLSNIDAAITAGGAITTGNTLAGQWDGTFATRMTEGWYDDPTKPGMFDRATFNEDYVPPEWRHDSSDNMPPAGAEQLFLEVVQPVCFVCHSRRGTTLGSNAATNGGKDIIFNSYEKFISHADQIKQYVFDRGVMPLSLRGYNAFWNEGSDAPEILAAHLNGLLSAENQIEINADGTVDEPGAPVADAGPDRTSTSPVRLFGSNSRFVDRYSWRIISEPAGSDAVLTESTTARPVLTTSVDGDYVIRLSAAYENRVVTDSVNIKIDNTLDASSTPPDPKTLTFDNQIRTILNTPQNPAFSSETDSKACDECHQDAMGAGSIGGVPVYWRDAQPTSGDTAANAFYQEIRSRIDFRDPENSLLLTKPSNNHHFGGLRQGFEVDNPANRQNYDIFLNWILEGAPEN